MKKALDSGADMDAVSWHTYTTPNQPDRIGLAEVMDRLDSGDRQLIRLRFFAGRTQSETARVLGTTQVQISRRERRILKWMREQLLEAQ